MSTLKSRPLQSKTLFFATSPRTPFKIIPEIALLDQELKGAEWNHETQRKFFDLLKQKDFYQGDGSRYPDLAARDRINRVPKSLGFVTLPVIGLSAVGQEFLSCNNKEEILLRQLLKFQVPSPYHPLGAHAAPYCVKPYLELLRLIRDLEDGLSFDELQIFGLQLIDYKLYDEIVAKITAFRRGRTEAKKENISYTEYKFHVFTEEARNIYHEEILSGNFRTRESQTTTEEEFLQKKIQNLRDYADAAVRNLRSTGIVSVTAIGRTLTILPERRKDVDYILSTVDRDPIYVKDLKSYQDYLWNPSLPTLLTDNPENIIAKLKADFGVIVNTSLPLNLLKGLLNEKIEDRKQQKIKLQIKDLKDYSSYNEIEETFETLNSYYDPSLFLEWNVWRAMTMINGGDIQANLKFDDNGQPMSTALGNMADIICDYGDFDVTVEVTLAKGALQWKMEGEPVPRHIGQHIATTNKPTYCFFIAPTINPATVAHFYTLYLSNVAMYGGKCCIIPLTLSTFRKMVQSAASARTKPNPSNIKELFDASRQYAKECFHDDGTEQDWYLKITEKAENWLS